MAKHVEWHISEGGNFYFYKVEINIYTFCVSNGKCTGNAQQTNKGRAFFCLFFKRFLRFFKYLLAYILYLLISNVAVHSGCQEKLFDSLKF